MGALFCRPTNDSKGALRACLISLSAAAGLPPGVLGFSTALTMDFAAGLPVFFPAAFRAGFAAGLAVCGAGLGAAGEAGCAACCGAVLAPPSADFTLLGVEGLTCARKPGAAAAIQIPSPRVIAERIVRSFPLRVSQARRLLAWPQVQEAHPRRQAW